MSHVEIVATDVSWASVVLNFQAGVQLRSNFKEPSCTPEWVSLMGPLNKVGFIFSSGSALDAVPVEEQPFFLLKVHNIGSCCNLLTKPHVSCDCCC